ncbi:uncharacterized protein LOC142353232 isoform X2 [Convolutriloba macropyga]|uniref:uncharacterized protein LOC142353232 isoform X2 n=1 Tax=Convolutriloba macropyga TaxID=536237 RepID=UPI003F5222E4
MAQAAQKTFLVVKINHQISRLQDVIAKNKPNFDIQKFELEINADLSELEKIVKIMVGSSESQSEVEELTNEMVALMKKVDDSLDAYHSAVCQIALMRVLPKKETLRKLDELMLFDGRTVLRFAAVMIAGAVLVVRFILYNAEYYIGDRDDVALKTTAWSSIFFLSFLEFLEILQRAVGFKSMCCKVFDVMVCSVVIVFWILSIGLLLLYEYDYGYPVPKGYRVLQIALCSIFAIIQFCWITVNVEEIIDDIRSRRSEDAETDPVELNSDLISL